MSKKKHIIPRVSKFEGDINDVLPLATDTLTSSLWRRVTATIIDMCIILCVSHFVLSPMVESFYHTPHSYEGYFSCLRTLGLVTFLFAAAYIALMNASAYAATCGQLLLRIHVRPLYGERISVFVALARFLIFSAPSVFLFARGNEEILSLSPTGIFPNYDTIRTEILIPEYFYVMLLVIGVVQFALIFPVLTSRYSSVPWDYALKTRILLKTPRTL